MRGVVSAELLFAPLLRSAHVVVSFFQTDRRHSRFRKRKVIGAKERSLLGPRIRRNAESEVARNRINHGFQGRTFSTKRNEILRWPKHVHRVEIDVRGGFVEWNYGMICIPFGAE